MTFRTGFGVPDTMNFARFTVMADRTTGMYPTFASALQTVVDPIIGSDDFEVQITGFGPSTVTLSLDFDSRDDYFKLQALVGKKHTLVLIAGFTAFEQDVKHVHGTDYESFPNTLLTSLVPDMRVGETYATATFVRSAQGMGVSSV